MCDVFGFSLFSHSYYYQVALRVMLVVLDAINDKLVSGLLTGDPQQVDMIRMHLKDAQEQIENDDVVVEELEAEVPANNSSNHQGVVIEEIIDDEVIRVQKMSSYLHSKLTFKDHSQFFMLSMNQNNFAVILYTLLRTE